MCKWEMIRVRSTTIYDGCFKVFIEKQQKVYIIIVISFISKLPEL